MLERVSERLYVDSERTVKAEIYRLPRTKAYVCRVTFANGEVVSSIAERKSWITVDGAKAWAKQVVAERDAE